MADECVRVCGEGRSSNYLLSTRNMLGGRGGSSVAVYEALSYVCMRPKGTSV
jgi:hypothetical protein